jgi:hypothetical protein
MADKPAIQSGNIYSLKASTLKGYENVRDAQDKFFDEDRVTLTTMGETVSQKIDNINRVQEFDNAMNFIYDNGGDTFSAENKTQLRGYIENNRDSLINSLTTGTGEIDKEAAEAAEGNLDQIAKGMAAWDVAKKETGIIGVDKNLGFSSAIHPLEEHVMKQIQTNKADLNIGEDGTVTFDITMPDGSVQNVNKNQYEALVAKNMLPKEFIADQVDRNVSLLDQGNNASAAIDITTQDGMQKYNDLKKQNEADIESGKASVQQILLDKNVVAGVPGTMFDAIVSSSNPAVRDFKYPVSKAKGAAEDANGDGFISMEDFEPGDYQKLLVEMLRPENAETTKAIIAEAMTLNNVQQFNKGFNDKQAGSATNQNSSTTSQGGGSNIPAPQGGSSVSQQGGAATTTNAPVKTQAEIKAEEQKARIQSQADRGVQGPAMTESEATFQGDIPAGTGRDTLPKRENVFTKTLKRLLPGISRSRSNQDAFDPESGQMVDISFPPGYKKSAAHKAAGELDRSPSMEVVKTKYFNKYKEYPVANDTLRSFKNKDGVLIYFTLDRTNKK